VRIGDHEFRYCITLMISRIGENIAVLKVMKMELIGRKSAAPLQPVTHHRSGNR
jgi:hypothetical protein